MDKMIGTLTLDVGHTDGALHGVRTSLHTTLYDLMQALQDEAGLHEEQRVVDAVMQLLRHNQIRFLAHPTHSTTACFDEALPISA